MCCYRPVAEVSRDTFHFIGDGYAQLPQISVKESTYRCAHILHNSVDNFVSVVFEYKGKGICIYSLNITVGSADFTLLTPRYWNSLFHTHLPGENAVHFLQL